MTPRRIMKEFRIDEISGVDDPAQKPARAVLMKRHDKNLHRPSDLDDTIQGGDEDTVNKGDAEMTPDEKAALEAKVTKAEADATAATKRAERAEKILALPVDQRALFAKIDGAAAQDAFLAKTPAERSAEVAKAADADPIVYSAADGTTFRKSDDPRLVAMAKRADESAKALADERVARTNDLLRKRAETEFPNLPGTVETKVALLKAVDAVEPAAKDEVLKILKASDAGLVEAMKRAGTSAAGPEAGSPEAVIESLVKAHMEKNPSVTYAKAYTEVVSKGAGAEAYAKYAERHLPK